MKKHLLKDFALIVLSGLLIFQSSFYSYATESAEITENVSEEASTEGNTTSGNSSEESSTPDLPANQDYENILTDVAPPEINAQSAIVMDANTGAILYEKNAYIQQYPASITKVMTVLVALQNYKSLNDVITMSYDSVWGIERDSNHIALDVGEEITVEQCLYAIVLQSANEASWAMAEYIGGDLDTFSDMMNAKAAELGCVNTHFVNPNGLHDDNHYVCAYDMALITQAAMQEKLFRTLCSTNCYTIPPTNKQPDERPLWNQDKIIKPSSIYYYQGAEGGKTGFTNEARNTLVSFAKRGDLELICVVLHCEGAQYTYTDTAALYDYVYDNYAYVHPLSNFTFSPVNDGTENFINSNYYKSLNHDVLDLYVDTNYSVLVPRTLDATQIQKEITLDTASCISPYALGKILLKYDGKIVGSTEILYTDITAPAITEPSEDIITSETDKKRNKIIIAGGSVFFVVVVLFSLFYFKNNRRRRRRNRSRKIRF